MTFLGCDLPYVELLVLALSTDVRLVHLDGTLKDLRTMRCHAATNVLQHAMYLVLAEPSFFCDAEDTPLPKKRMHDTLPLLLRDA